MWWARRNLLKCPPEKYYRPLILRDQPGGGGDEKKAPSTQSLVKIKSVTQNLALAYDNWITDVDLEDHGLLAFHVQGLVAKMAEAYKVEHDGKNDEAEQDAAKYFDLPAEFLKPFATIDASTRERKSETLSELLIDQWGTRHGPFNSTPMGVNLISFGSPHVRPMGVHQYVW